MTSPAPMLPCPFCGSDPIIRTRHTIQCHCGIELNLLHSVNAAWNRRFVPEISDAVVEKMCAAQWNCCLYRTEDWEDVDKETQREQTLTMRAAIQAMRESEGV